MFSLSLPVQTTPIARPSLVSAARFSPRSEPERLGLGGYGTTLADLCTLLFAANPFSAVRASLRRWSSDEFEDGLAHGGQCRPRRQPVDSFFSRLAVLSRCARAGDCQHPTLKKAG